MINGQTPNSKHDRMTKILNFGWVIALIFMPFFGNFFVDAKAAVLPAGNNKCESEIKGLAADQLKDFRDFLEKNFQNKSSTSSLLPLVLGKYREMRRELYNIHNQYYPNQGAAQSVVGLEPAGCLKIVEDTLTDARILLRKQAVKTSGVKKTTALIEKYQAINDMLSGLHQQFVLLKGYLDTFANKLPCYVKNQCLKSR